MKEWFRKLSTPQLMAVFAVPYVIVCLMALFPPLYLWASGSTSLFLGMPATMWYWLVIPVVCTVVTWLLYLVEGSRGELDLELADANEVDFDVPCQIIGTVDCPPDEQGVPV